MSADRPRRPAGRGDGFTLLEVVIAMAIAALALVALFNVGGGGLMAVETAGHVDEAVERARSHLAALGRDTPLAAGEYDGDDGGGFRWHLSVQPFATAEQGDAPMAGLFKVDVAISWQERGRRRNVTLTTLRLQASG